MFELSKTSLLLLSVLGAIAAAIFFRDAVVPAAVYAYNLAFYSREVAEDEALAAMGENRASYLVKDQIKKNRVVDQKEVNDLQDGVGDVVGGLVGKGSIGEAVGESVSDAADTEHEHVSQKGLL